MSFSASVEKLVETSPSPLVGKGSRWERVPLSFIAEILNGYPWKSVHFNDQEGVPVIRIRDVTAGATDTLYRGRVEDGFWVEDGDLLIGMDGDFNSRIWEGGKALLNQRVCRVRTNKAFYQKELLAYVLPGYLQLINDETHSITVKHLSSKTLAEIPLPLPPLSEQVRIVAKVDSLSAKSRRAREHLDHIPRLVGKYKQSILTAAFTGELTINWRESHGKDYYSEKEVYAREKGRSGLRRTRGTNKVLDGLHLADLPTGWSWIRNHRLAVDASNAICAGPFGTIFKAKDFRKEGVPIVFLRHVSEGKYLDRKPTFMDRSVWEQQHQPYSIYGGELLVTKLGDPPGTACIYPSGRGTAMVTPDVMKMTVDNEVADARYLMHFFNSPICKTMVQELAFGLTRLRIDLTMFKAFPIPLAPALEQSEVVRRIDTAFAWIDRLTSEATSARGLIDHLDQAVLAKAFRGELAPGDPNDEPASVLLERIRAERDAAPARAGTRRRSA